MSKTNYTSQSTTTRVWRDHALLRSVHPYTKICTARSILRRHIGQFSRRADKNAAQSMQAQRCPHGKNALDLPLSKQTQHSPKSVSPGVDSILDLREQPPPSEASSTSHKASKTLRAACPVSPPLAYTERRRSRPPTLRGKKSCLARRHVSKCSSTPQAERSVLSFVV